MIQPEPAKPVANAPAASPDNRFAPNQPLGRLSFRGGRIMLAATLAQRLLGLAFLALLARLLSPHDYGLFGMVIALTGFLTLFSDLGLSWATVQQKHLSPAQFHNLFWLNVAFGLLLALLTAAVAPLLAAFYHESQVVPITRLAACNFVLAAIGIQPSSLLHRRMAFGAVVIAETIGVLLGGVLGLVLAFHGFGVYALVAQLLAASAARSFANCCFARYCPGLPSLRAGLGGAGRFGSFVSLFNLVNYFSRNLDKLLLGRFAGPAVLGLYTRSYALMWYPIGLVAYPANRVMIPMLSALQDDMPRFRQAYLRALRLVAFASFLLVGLLVIAAREFILVLFGSQWLDAVPLFRILAFAALGQGIYHATGPVFYATGRTDRMLYLGIAQALLLCLAYFLGLPWGATGIALAYTLAFTLGILPFLVVTYRTVGIPLSHVLRHLWPPLTACTAASALLLALRALLPNAAYPLLTLAWTWSAFSLAYIALAALLDRALALDLRQALHLPLSRKHVPHTPQAAW